MQTLTEIADTLGRDELCRRLNVGETAIFNAIAKGYFPSGWFGVMTILARERGVSIPFDKFNWRKAAEIE